MSNRAKRAFIGNFNVLRYSATLPNAAKPYLSQSATYSVLSTSA